MNYIPYQKTELCELFEKYKADKCPAVHHTYSPSYYELLNPIKHQIKNMLEIGIGNIPLMTQIIPEGYIPGASIKAWRDFFPNATVYAVDILPEVLFEDERIKTYQLDQSSIESIQNFINIVKKETSEDFIFDYIIDDGSHIIDHMIISGYEFPKYLKKDGIYIIEDIQNKYLPALMDVKFPNLEMTHVYNGGSDWDNFLVYKKI
jgi:hypothetical protein